MRVLPPQGLGFGTAAQSLRPVIPPVLAARLSPRLEFCCGDVAPVPALSPGQAAAVPEPSRLPGPVPNAVPAVGEGSVPGTTSGQAGQGSPGWESGSGPGDSAGLPQPALGKARTRGFTAIPAPRLSEGL